MTGDIKMPFGSFKGKSLDHIYKVEPDYLVWVRDNCEPPIRDRVADFLSCKNREIVLKSCPICGGKRTVKRSYREPGIGLPDGNQMVGCPRCNGKKKNE